MDEESIYIGIHGPNGLLRIFIFPPGDVHYNDVKLALGHMESTMVCDFYEGDMVDFLLRDYDPTIVISDNMRMLSYDGIRAR